MKTSGMSILKMLFVCNLLFLSQCDKTDKSTKRDIVKDDVERTGIVGEVIGTLALNDQVGPVAQLMSENETTWKGAKVGDKIGSGDKISIDANGTAMVRLANNTRLALNSNTRITLQTPSSLFMDKGEIWVEGAMACDRCEVSIKTGSGEVSMKGAVAGVRYKDQLLTTSVISGQATVRGDKREVLVRGGQEASVDRGVLKVMVVKDPEALVSWTTGLKNLMERGSKTGDGIRPFETPQGLGTLSAKVPGTRSLLPFEILSQDVTVRIQDQVALTQVEQVFRNPTNRVVEGMYKFPIPEGATLNRYDMEIKGKMMPGEIVERKRGRVIMKTVIRQFIDMMRDPALTEWESGSTFKTRIFPIQPKEKKRIILSYIQTLKGSGGKYHYVLPVSAAGADTEKVPAFRIDAQITGSGGVPKVTTPLYPAKTTFDGPKARVGFEATDFKPLIDFVIEIDSPNRKEATLVTYGKGEAGIGTVTYPNVISPASLVKENWNYFMVNVAPTLEGVLGSKEDGSDWILLVDTSQSRSHMDLAIQKRLTASIIGSLGMNDRVKVLSYDMTTSAMDSAWAKPTTALIEKTVAFLDSIPQAGATNMAGALIGAADQVASGRPSNVIIIGDGAATLGERRPAVLSEWAAQIFDPLGASITTIGVGSSVDSLLFEALSRRTGGKYHYLSSGESLLAAAVRIITSLRVPVLENPVVRIEGLAVKDMQPSVLENLGSGEEVTITGKYRGAGLLRVVLSGMLAGNPWTREYAFNVGKAKQANSFVPFIWASRKIDALTLVGDEKAIKEIVQLSKKYSLPSRYTSFIVLENESMYREFRVGHGDDRFDWEGVDEIEYEDSEEDEADKVASGHGSRTSGMAGGKSMDILAPSKKSMRPQVAASRSARPPMTARSRKKPGQARDPLSGSIGEELRERSPEPCRSGYDYEVKVGKRPRAASDKDKKKIAELKAKIAESPLVRKLRRSLVKELMGKGRYTEAMGEVSKWWQMDRANPMVLVYLGDLLRLNGNIDQAIRYYSGVLDVRPEDTKIMKLLASYLEYKKQWSLAHAFRVSIHLLKPKDPLAIAKRAITAARADMWGDAVFTAGRLVEQGPDGTFKLKRKIKLKKEMKEAVLRIAQKEKPPLSSSLPNRPDASRAKFSIVLEWDGNVDLDLWVATRRDKFLGSEGGYAKQVDGKTGREGEVFYMPKATPASYTVQVQCAEQQGCENIKGKVKIKAHGTNRTIPFVLEQGGGRDIAAIRVERYKWLSGCY